jgi:NADH-ubiquinone oxidoreductase chain 6
MYSLGLINESYTNGYKVEILDILSLVAILCGILVIVCKNPIVSVLFLIGLFLSIASYLIILGLSFIGLSYLLVYVGAVSILFLFILMLINVRTSELLSNTSNSIPLAIFISISFIYSVYGNLPYSIAAFTYTIKDNNIYSAISSYFSNLIFKRSEEIDNDQIYLATSNL